LSATADRRRSLQPLTNPKGSIMKKQIKLSVVALAAVFSFGCEKKLPITDDKETVMQVILKTGVQPNSSTNNLEISVLVNSDARKCIQLDNPNVDDFESGSRDSFVFAVDQEIDTINNIRLSVSGTDAWFAEGLTVRLFSYGQQKQLEHKFNINKWFSSEQDDIDKLNAIQSMSYDFKDSIKATQ